MQITAQELLSKEHNFETRPKKLSLFSMEICMGVHDPMDLTCLILPTYFKFLYHQKDKSFFNI